MPINKMLRVRVDRILRERLTRYVEQENKRGRSIDMSYVVREALVEYLDREERPPSKNSAAI